MKRTAFSAALLGSVLLGAPLARAAESGAATTPPERSRDTTAPLAEAPLPESAPPATSQTEPVEAARILFEKGRTLAASAHYIEACNAFEESLALSRRVSTEFNLADCWERVGRLASAHDLYLKIAAELEQTAELPKAEISRRRAAWLRDRLCGLSVEPQEPHAGLVVTLAGRELSVADLEEAVPIDPGTHRVTVSAPDRKEWTTDVEVESCPALISVVVPPLRAREKPKAVSVAPAPAAVPTPAAHTPVVAPAATPPVVLAPSSEQNLLWPVAAGTIGAGALVVGVVSAVQFQSKNDAARGICPTGFDCTTEEIARHTTLVLDARSQATWAYVGFGVGAAGLGGAILLYLLDRPSADTTKDRRARVGVTPVAAPDAWGAVVRGSF